MKKENRLDVSFRHADDRRKLLLINPMFKLMAKEFRKRWAIPDEGYENKNDAGAWRDWVHIGRAFKPNQDDIRREVWRQGSINKITRSGSLGRLFQQKSVIKGSLTMQRAVQNHISDILRNVNYGPKWYPLVEKYLIFGALEVSQPQTSPSGVTFRFDYDENTGQEIILAIITDETTDEDLSVVLKSVRSWQKNLSYRRSTRNRKSGTLGRDIRVYKLRVEDGLPAKEVAEKINLEFPDDPAVAQQDIYGIVQRINRKLSR